MDKLPSRSTQIPAFPPNASGKNRRPAQQDFPWWLLALVVMILWTVWIVITRSSYREAFLFIIVGIWTSIAVSLVSYAIAIILGLLTALAQISRNVFLKNAAKVYVEAVRGIPMLVLIFFIALVGVPMLVDGLNAFGGWLSGLGAGPIGAVFTNINNNAIPMGVRAVIALSVTYGAYLSEIFRAGIQSIPRGQMEAGKALGMSYIQTMRWVILPQAVRNVLPALGNDFVSMVKDSSLVSVLAVRDITQMSRLYAGRTFRFREAYLTLSMVYLTLTVTLSWLLQRLEKRLKRQE
ncbi:MAG: amino acid ABC transporter permease [Chloroflexota bacterium]